MTSKRTISRRAARANAAPPFARRLGRGGNTLDSPRRTAAAAAKAGGTPPLTPRSARPRLRYRHIQLISFLFVAVYLAIAAWLLYVDLGSAWGHTATPTRSAEMWGSTVVDPPAADTPTEMWGS